MSQKKRLTPAVFLRPLTFSVFFLIIFPLIYATTAIGLEMVPITAVQQNLTIEYESMVFAAWQARIAPAVWTMACCVLAGWLGAEIGRASCRERV